MNWETHHKGCPNRRPTVAYPRHACDLCRAYERGLADAVDVVKALDRYPKPNATIYSAEAVAAIDALRGESHGA